MSDEENKVPLAVSLVMAVAKVRATNDEAAIKSMREAVYAAERGYRTVPIALTRVVRALIREPHECSAVRWEAVAAVALAAKDAAS